LVSYFHVWLSRSQATAQSLLGQGLGNFTSDRYSAYNWLAVSQRQVCWAHLKRDFTHCRTSGASAEVGRALLSRETPVCLVVSSPRWHLVSSRFERAVAPIRSRVHELLIAAATNEIGTRRKRPGQKTRTCRQLLQVEPALWLFVTTVGVEPMPQNEPFVPLSYGDAVSGLRVKSFFVARMLSVMTTLRSQNRDVLAYLVQACRAARQGKPAPSLLPLCLASQN